MRGDPNEREARSVCASADMRSVKINRRRLYQPRRCINNLAITASRERERESVFLDRDESQLEEEAAQQEARWRRRRCSSSTSVRTFLRGFREKERAKGKEETANGGEKEEEAREAFMPQHTCS